MTIDDTKKKITGIVLEHNQNMGDADADEAELQAAIDAANEIYDRVVGQAFDEFKPHRDAFLPEEMKYQETVFEAGIERSRAQRIAHEAYDKKCRASINASWQAFGAVLSAAFSGTDGEPEETDGV